MNNKQISFAVFGDELAKVNTNRKVFLEKTERIFLPSSSNFGDFLLPELVMCGVALIISAAHVPWAVLFI